jgi:HEAT repeat protein
LRAAAIQALVRLKGSADSTAVIVDRLLDSPYWIVRTQAALAIVHLPAGRDATTRHLERMLHDPEPVVQSAVALALGFIGSDAEPAIPTLRNLAGDPRNIVPNRFRTRVGPPRLDFVPGDVDLMRLSVAAAARSALTAIESADDPPRPDQKSDGR